MQHPEVTRLLAHAGADTTELGYITHSRAFLERLLELDPDRIIMLISDPQTSETHLEEHRRFWDRLSQLRAVRNNGIHFLVGAENFRTGPGILKLVTTLRRALQSPTEERP